MLFKFPGKWFPIRNRSTKVTKKIEFDAARVNTTVGPKSEMYRMLSRMIAILCKLRSGDINNFIYDKKTILK